MVRRLDFKKIQVAILANKSEDLGGIPRVATRNVTGKDITERLSSRRLGQRARDKPMKARSCGQHKPGFSVPLISRKLRRFWWPCLELKKIYPALTLRQVNCVPPLLRVRSVGQNREWKFVNQTFCSELQR